MVQARLINLTLRPDDAEPILREAARLAAMHSSYLDHITLKTWDNPGRTGHLWADTRKRWREIFLHNKRIVESFGIDYEQVSESETLTVQYPHVRGTIRPRNIPGIGIVNEIIGAGLDYNNPEPAYRKAVHREACEHAANRVVAAWRKNI